MANLSLVSASLPLGEFGALQKMRLAVAMPLILVGIVAAYSVLKFVSVHCSSTANHDVRARLSRFLVHKAVTVLSSLFTALSIFYMRAILRPFNCIRDGTDGIAYMASSPDIPCIAGDAEYAELVALSTNGLAVYAGCYAVISFGLVVEMRSDRPGLGTLAFLGDKYEEEYYYWEMVVVARKLGLMVSFYLFSDSQAWLCGTTVLVVALTVHAGARPYEDPTVDWSEFLTLVANLLILVSGPVFTVLHETGRGAVFRQTLEVVGAVVMTAAVVMAGVAQRHVWVAVRQKDGEDYKVRVVEARVLEAEERVKTLKHQLRTLKEVEAELEHQQEEERAYEPELARAIDDVLEAIETSDPNGDVPSGRASKLVSKQDMQVFDNPLTTDEAEA
jgi:hypothetical protein